MSFYMKLAKLLLGKKHGKALDKYVELKKDPKFNFLMGNLEKSQQELEDTVKDYCIRWPDSALCKKHK